MRRTDVIWILGAALALLIACDDDGGGKKAVGGSCSADDERSSGVCFESTCYATCTKQATCETNEFCVNVDRNGAAASICRPATAHAGCTSHDECEDLVSGPCDSIHCNPDRGICEASRVSDGESCETATGVGTCQSGSCAVAGAEVHDEIQAEVTEPPAGDCVADLPEKTLFAGDSMPQQITIVTDAGSGTVTTFQAYNEDETIVIDNNGDGTYLVTTGTAWTMLEVSHGEYIDHDNWFEWKDAPSDTELTITLRNKARGHSVTLMFMYDAEGVTLVSVCFEEALTT